MKKLKPIISALLVLSMVLALAACGKSSQSSGTSSSGSSNASSAKPTQIVISRNADSANLDPILQDDNVNIWMFNLVLDGLVKSSDDGKKVEPALATNWDISDDKLTYTFHLRDGLKFSDGTPVKAEDWVYSITRARDTKESPWAFTLENVKDIKASDDKTVVITLKQPSAAILADLAMFNASVMPKAYFDKVGAKGLSEKPIGTGPYYLAEWKKGDYMLFKKNTYYWQQGLPKADEIKVTVVPDDNTRIMQLQAGQIDAATFIPWNRMTELNQDPKLSSVAIPSTEVRYVAINTTRKPLNDVRVRQALELATDKDALVKTVLYGFGQKAASFLPPTDGHYDANLKAYTYDINKAKDLLTQAGVGSGFQIKLVVPSGNTVQQQIATVLKDQWAKVGITVNISQLEATTASAQYKKMDYDISLRGWTNDIIDSSELIDYTCIYANAKNFYTGWKNDEVEKLANAAKVELDETKRTDMYNKIQELYLNDVPMIPLFYVPYPVAMSKKVSGFVQTPLGNYMFQNLEKK